MKRPPVLLAVDEDRDALDDVETQLVKRYATTIGSSPAAILFDRLREGDLGVGVLVHHVRHET